MNRLSPLASLTTLTLLLAACSGGGGGTGGGGFGPIFTPPTTSPIIGPTNSPGQPASGSLFACPSSTTSFAHSSAATERHIAPARSSLRASDANTLIATYSKANAAVVEPAIASRASTSGAAVVGSLRFDAIGRSARVIHVTSANQASVKAALAALPGVTVTNSQRLRALTKSPITTNDPYFESNDTATVPGQWDMHAVGMDYAYAYSLGSRNVRLAIIDTGMDVTQPDIASDSIARTRCFISDTNGVQSTGSYVADPQGHGTDVTGIAGAGVNNGFGFVGTGGNLSLMLYRVFPTADDSCLDPTTTNPQCGAADVDVASAIDDAVSNGANVISMSLGGGPCTAGQDPSTIEGNAVANAIASNVIVVAASGNENATTVDSPGCDPGVISVGASGYNDGQPNGTGYNGSNKEYVASYSNGGETIVAPGGDPTDSSDNDNFHWIENIWTSTPYDANYAGDCNPDAFGENNDCRTLIAGTSMATPHVAGAAALVLSVNSSYASPSSMKQLLCQSADNINDTQQGCGRLNVYRAMAIATGDPNLP